MSLPVVPESWWWEAVLGSHGLAMQLMAPPSLESDFYVKSQPIVMGTESEGWPGGVMPDASDVRVMGERLAQKIWRRAEHTAVLQAEWSSAVRVSHL